MIADEYKKDSEQRSRIAVFGTSEPAPVPRQVRVGPLSVDLVQGVIRGLRWRGVETIRAIDCPVRDRSWATCPSESTYENFTAGDHAFEYIQQRRIADGAILCRLTYTGTSQGVFRAAAELVGQQDFFTNRAGFTVLHPLAGLAGASLTILHADGATEAARFPALISPGQVAFDITGLAYSVCGVDTEIFFKGESFEMEDQRNWSDASFKTYCRPLSLPIPYRIRAGEIVRQEIEIRLSDVIRSAKRPSRGSDTPLLRFEPSGERMPTIALAVDATAMPGPAQTAVAQLLAPQILQLRIDKGEIDAALAVARCWEGEGSPQFELEIVVPEQTGLIPYLSEVAERCRQASVRIARVMPLPEAYLRNYQPEGPWPDGPSPRAACIAARKCFPGAQVGGGVLTHFVELNRCRPDPDVCDYISHGSTAILHAADDRSVIESLEGLGHVFGSARALADGRDYRLGLVSIGMRSNPHGTDVVPNPGQTRMPMARVDPRQRGLFAAAWGVGAMNATQGHHVLSLALAALVGPFGIIYTRASWPQPIYDELPHPAVYPLFHVVRALLQMAAAERLLLRGLPRGVVGVAARGSMGTRLLLANLTEDSCPLRMPHNARVRQLDPDSFQSAVTDPDWLTTSPSEPRAHLALNPYNVAFVEVPSVAA